MSTCTENQPEGRIIGMHSTHVLLHALLLLSALVASNRPLGFDAVAVLFTGHRSRLTQGSHQCRLGVLEGLKETKGGQWSDNAGTADQKGLYLPGRAWTHSGSERSSDRD